MQKLQSTYSILENVLQHSILLNQIDESLQQNPEESIQKIWEKARATQSGSTMNEVINPGTLLIQLYGLIVFPWERLKKTFRRDATLRKTPLSQWCNFQIYNLAPAMQRKPILLFFTLELMRNAISHADVRIDGQLRITFKDRRGTVIAFDYEQLKIFLTQLTEYYNSES